ncbi:ciliary neurotrophic factor isoform X1 [Phycodurus eques]|uniref:ciliary neurotrophic factor isoform X1 n=1 Tax=Phycodurus eques TaxID=693459 RepID=UPI002ACDDCA3|nr:ciliary neurotrophic factor isoform X1 [Phycodurus eques]
MAERRDPGGTGGTAARAAAVAELLRVESANLLELYRKRERLAADVIAGDGRLVSVAPPSARPDAADKLRRLHAALLRCRGLMESAVAKEDEEMGGGTGEYETLRKTVKERLSSLVNVAGELVKAAGGPAALTPTSSDGSEPDDPGVFGLKLWLFRVYAEVDFWAKTAVATFRALRNARSRSARSARR